MDFLSYLERILSNIHYRVASEVIELPTDVNLQGSISEFCEKHQQRVAVNIENLSQNTFCVTVMKLGTKSRRPYVDYAASRLAKTLPCS